MPKTTHVSLDRKISKLGRLGKRSIGKCTQREWEKYNDLVAEILDDMKFLISKKQKA